ncbi:MAG: 3-phenylpropionate/trans-cinnamate dioxygenase ferredoxin reductase component [Chthoniobacter sp.]|nr:3-phenylpropionate/trans-cinnamate dioxygenase ferredoxin reductase component [Chthoniobacter sp.]
MNRDYLIIGAGIAGACACEGIRQHDKKGSVSLIGREAYLPYNRPPLSKAFLKTPQANVSELLHADAAWFAKQKIEVRTDTLVRALNLERRLAVLENGQTIQFKKALFATGSRPRRPAVAGATLGNVFYLSTIRDALAIKESGAGEKSVIIVGGGLLAVEAAASLTQAKLKVTLMNRQQALWQKWLDPETAQWLTGYFRSRGVTLMLGQDLNGFEGKTVLKNVQTKSGERFPSHLALVAVGSEPNLDLVLNTPLSSPAGTPVNDYLETDEKGIFAAGDVALFPDKISGAMRRLTHWDNAREQGKVAGQNMTGKKRIKFDYVPYFFSDLFDLNFEFFGDFTLPPSRFECEGTREKRKFRARYFRGDKLVALVHCNQDPALGKAAREEIRHAARS